jgi:prepilin-type processing-associated H-X9-DG protein
VQAAREAARRSQCTNNLKQYGIAIHNYIDSFKVVPMSGNMDWNQWDAAPALGWQARILPFTEQQPLYQQFNFGPNYPTIPNFGAQPPQVPIQWVQDGNVVARARKIIIPFQKCPSDTNIPVFWESTSDGIFEPSYGGSLGSQTTPSNPGSQGAGGLACQPFLPFALKNADHGNTNDPNEISGMFGRCLFMQPMTLSYVTDGTSNTIMVGEILPLCNDHSGYSPNLYYNGSGNAHASTIVPMNDMTTCHVVINPSGQAGAAQDPLASAPQCWDWSNWNYSWGFRSKHPAGCNFLMVDGSVRFLGQNINHITYQRLGGKADGFTISAADIGP